MKSILSYLLSVFLAVGVAFASQANPYTPPTPTISGWDYTSGTLSALDLTYANFSNVTAIGTTFSGANFSGDVRDFSYASFANANLTNSTFDFAILIGADFTNALISGATFFTDFENMDNGLTAEQLYSTQSYKNNDLKRISLYHKDLRGWNFSGQDLSNAQLGEALFTGADFTNAIIVGATIGWSRDNAFTATQLYSTKSYKDKKLQGVDFSWLDVSGWNFSGQDLSNAQFFESTCRGADFTDATISGAHMPNNFTMAQLCSTKSYQNHDLRKVWVFFHDGINLSGQNLSEALLFGSVFSDADLTNATLSSAELHGADFTNATISGADLSATTKGGFTARQLYSTQNYKDKDLQGINLSSNSMVSWNFSGQNLSNAKLSNAILSGSDFSGADLSNAMLSSSVFNGANLTNATLSTATLSGADFSYADLRGAEMSGTTGSYTTKNTIGTNGTFANLSMTSETESVTVRKYITPEGKAEITAKIADAGASIGSGAALTLQEGAKLDVVSGAQLSLDRGSQLIFEIDPFQTTDTRLAVKDGATLAINEGAQFIVNLSQDIYDAQSQVYLVSCETGGTVSGAANLVKNETVFVRDINGNPYSGDWDIVLSGDGVGIIIPEPAAGAALLGLGALLCVIRRKKVCL